MDEKIKKLNASQFEEIEPEEKPTSTSGKIKAAVILVLSSAICLFHFYTAGFGSLSTLDQRLVHWTGMLLLIYLMYPAKKKWMRPLDYLMIAGVLVAGLYLYTHWRQVAITGSGTRTAFEILLGAAAIYATLVVTKRTCGWVLPIVALVFLAYLFFGQYLPPSIGHRQYSLNRIVTILYFGTEGLFGSAIGVSSTIIIIFILFGSLLSASGGGKVFIDLAFALTGRYRGGAAKTAVLSSALMGTVSGSPIANVVTTGTFTIPLMKKSGYRAHVAGAVEAVASTGGQIMPPIMGAAAFIMAEYIGVPFSTVAWAAVIPAILYFVSIFIIVDVEALKNGIHGLPVADLPRIRMTLQEGWPLLAPLGLLLVLILSNYSVTYSVFYSTVLLMIIWLFRLKFDLNEFVRGLMSAFKDTVRSASSVVAACACAGIIVGTIQLTSIGLRLCSLIEVMAHGYLLIALVFSMIVAVIMGMGLPTTVLYIILSVIIAPALVNLGADKLQAHMFVFYFGCMSSITPPVALAAFGAAPIAKAPYTKIGWTAFRFGLVAFIIPYMFMYGPAIMFQGAWYEIILAFVSSLIGTAALAYGIQGWLLAKTNFAVRIALFASAVLLINQGFVTDLIGMALFVLCLMVQSPASRRKLTNSA